ncbi:MAG: NAD(P)/FAD-dependent oxidoreductase [Chitinophagaceae bacterium]
MQKTITLKALPSEADNELKLKEIVAQACAVTVQQITGFIIQKRSIDARSRQIFIHLTLNVFINEPPQPQKPIHLQLQDVHASDKKVIVIGAGPAGLFAALRLIEYGIKPIILERGKDVRARRRDLAIMNKYGLVNAESNYCFGEGGAGTYSDGKLYTRSTKRGDVRRILNIFVRYGAAENILYEAHPHIGTNKLPHIITALRNEIIDCGGEVHFEKKVIDFLLEKDKVHKVITADGDQLIANAVILATGHSARDIFQLLHSKNLQLFFKPFALGVRVEHPQWLIDAAQYRLPFVFNNKGTFKRPSYLPAASYNLVQQVSGKGVFSFCMCPGGIIAPAATDANEIVVNGWSPSKRNNPYANSGMVVSVQNNDLYDYIDLIEKEKSSPLIGMFFQQKIEREAYKAGGGKLVAPAQRLVDFTNNTVSQNLPDCSYLPGIHSADLRFVVPPFIHSALKIAFKEFGKKIKGYFTNEAVVVATESRTSSPVRIPRDNDGLHHPQLKNLYPCGEGAGFAGGIVSAAMDGEKVAGLIAAKNFPL